MRAAVEYQVEFDITAAAVKLELPFAFAVGRVFAAGDNGAVGFDIGLARFADKVQAGGEIPAIQIVEKQAADPARFFAVFEIEIAVAPVFVFIVEAV